jgi:TolB protein
VQRGGSFDLAVVSIDGSEISWLTEGAANDKRPAVSPDGRWIAFESDRDSPNHIYRMKADGSEIRRLTREGYNYGPSWTVAGRDSVQKN